mgnify:CR=1 FL=1
MEFSFQNPYFRYTVIVVATLAGAFLLSKLLRALMNKFFKKLNVDTTRLNFLKNAISFLIFIIALVVIFYMIPELRALGVTLFASAGIITAILALGAQQAFSNIFNGVFLVIYKPISVGDFIQVGNLYEGFVEDITLRHTVIRNLENKRILIPNSVINSETIINNNISDSRICNYIEIGISYDSDVNKAMKIMQDISAKHESCIDVRTEADKAKNVPQVIVRVLGFGDSSVNLRAFVWSKDWLSGFYMSCDLNKAIKEEFDRQGIEIPFPYRTVVFKEKSQDADFE